MHRHIIFCRCLYKRPLARRFIESASVHFCTVPVPLYPESFALSKGIFAYGKRCGLFGTCQLLRQTQHRCQFCKICHQVDPIRKHTSILSVRNCIPLIRCEPCQTGHYNACLSPVVCTVLKGMSLSSAILILATNLRLSKCSILLRYNHNRAVDRHVERKKLFSFNFRRWKIHRRPIQRRCKPIARMQCILLVDLLLQKVRLKLNPVCSFRCLFQQFGYRRPTID